MGIRDLIQADVKTILTNTGDFAHPVIFSVTGGSMVTTVTCNAMAYKHNIVWQDGMRIRVNSLNARVTVSELALKALGYPVRDTNNQVHLIGHRVTWTDISGVQITYTVTENYPNEVTGVILCRLSPIAVATPPGRVIIGWISSRFDLEVVETVDPDVKIELANGDEINAQYTLNDDGTLTIPYLVGYNVLTPFMIDGGIVQIEPYDIETGTFDNSVNGGFLPTNKVSFNASIPVWQS